LHVGGHVGGDIAPVKLHALHDLGIGVGGLGLLNGDDAVGRDLLHGVGDQLADLLVAGGHSTDTGDVLGAVHGLGLLLDLGHRGFHGLGHALLHHDGIGAGGQILQTLMDHG
ncbi:putative HTH-type transcriptional regulator yybR, partial [Dysosmobacter welbionis]